MKHFDKCQSRFETFEPYWTESYEQIVDFSVVEKMIEIAIMIDNSRKMHVFCQRAVQDLTGSLATVDGRVGQGTVDAINFAIRSGLTKQLKMTISHYTANYIQPRVSPSEYPRYLKTLFQ